MLERWRDIPGWVGYYQASDQGRVRSVDRIVRHSWGGPKRLKGVILKANPSDSYGHLAVNLCKDGIQQNIQVHRLVALTWLGPYPPGQVVRHGENGILDNSVDNLCYGTKSQDGLDCRRDGTHGGRAVRRSDGVEFINMHIAAEETACWQSCICEVCKGNRNTAGGYGWEYVDVNPSKE